MDLYISINELMDLYVLMSDAVFNCCCESKRATARYMRLMLNFLGQKMLFRANEITL